MLVGLVPLYQVVYPSRLGQDWLSIRLCLWYQDPYRSSQGPHYRSPLGQIGRFFDRRLPTYVFFFPIYNIIDQEPISADCVM